MFAQRTDLTFGAEPLYAFQQEQDDNDSSGDALARGMFKQFFNHGNDTQGLCLALFV
jgi:hypothetical protein